MLRLQGLWCSKIKHCFFLQESLLFFSTSSLAQYPVVYEILLKKVSILLVLKFKGSLRREEEEEVFCVLTEATSSFVYWLSWD